MPPSPTLAGESSSWPAANLAQMCARGSTVPATLRAAGALGRLHSGPVAGGRDTRQPAVQWPDGGCAEWACVACAVGSLEPGTIGRESQWVMAV